MYGRISRPRPRGLRERGLIPGMVKRFSLFWNVQNGSRSHPPSSSIGGGDLSLGVRRPGHEAVYSPLSIIVSTLRMHGTVLPYIHTRLCCEQGQLYLTWWSNLEEKLHIKSRSVYLATTWLDISALVEGLTNNYGSVQGATALCVVMSCIFTAFDPNGTCALEI